MARGNDLSNDLEPIGHLLYSSDQREDLIFSATMQKAKNQSFWITDKFDRRE